MLWAMGLAHQPPAFAIPIPGFQPGGLRGGSAEAVQESMGIEWNLGSATIATATVFHNAFFNMSDALGVTQPSPTGARRARSRPTSLAGDPGGREAARSCMPRFTSGTVGPDRSGGGGQAAESSDTQHDRAGARGPDERNGLRAGALRQAQAHRAVRRLPLVHALALDAHVQRPDVRRGFDRTHVLNVAVAYDLGRNWSAGARVIFYTGLPKRRCRRTRARGSRRSSGSTCASRSGGGSAERAWISLGRRVDERYAQQGTGRNELHPQRLSGDDGRSGQHSEHRDGRRVLMKHFVKRHRCSPSLLARVRWQRGRGGRSDARRATRRARTASRSSRFGTR